MDSVEYRFINNLSVLMECGRPLVSALQNLQSDSANPAIKAAFAAMVKCAASGGDFTDPLSDYPQLCSRSSLALLKAARRSSCLVGVLPKLADLVRAKTEGGLDPRGRFFETWALLVESGFSIEESLTELKHDFSQGPLAEVAEGLRVAAISGKSLASAAERFPETFDASSRDLLSYGEARDLARALRAITRLV